MPETGNSREIESYKTKNWNITSVGLNICVPTYVAPNRYPVRSELSRVKVCETWKWELSPLLTRSLAPSKNIGKTPWHFLCNSSMVPGLFGSSRPGGGGVGTIKNEINQFPSLKIQMSRLISRYNALLVKEKLTSWICWWRWHFAFLTMIQIIDLKFGFLFQCLKKFWVQRLQYLLFVCISWLWMARSKSSSH